MMNDGGSMNRQVGDNLDFYGAVLGAYLILRHNQHKLIHYITMHVRLTISRHIYLSVINWLD